MAKRIKVNQQKILDCFVKTHGFCLMGPVTYPSGLRAPFNVDFMTVLSDPRRAAIIGQALGDAIKTFFDVDIIIGIATAGIPVAVLASQYAEKPFVFVRPHPSERTGEVIQGQYIGATKAVLMDDVVGRGKTKDQVLDLISPRFTIRDLVVMCDGGKGYDDLESSWEQRTGITIHYLARWDEITKVMLDAGTIPRDVGEIMLEYLADPEAFQNNKEAWERFENFRKRHHYQLADPII